MAFLPQGQNQQQDQNQQGTQNQIPVIPSLQGSGGPTASQTGGTTNTASPASSPSTPWQNVSSYLQANAGQAGSVANVLAGNLTNQYNTANQAIGNENQNFGQQIQSGRVPLNQSMADQAAATPGSFVQDPNNVAAFQKMWNANYSGPQNFSQSNDYSNLQSQVQNAQTNAGLVNQGTKGLMTLLQQAESAQGKNPTQGITALDSLLLQEDPSNFSTIANAAAPFSGLTNYLSSTQQGLDTQAQQAASEAANTKNTLQNQFLGPNGVVQNMTNQQNAALQDLSKQATTYDNSITDVINRLNTGQPLTDQQIYSLDQSGMLYALLSGGGVNAKTGQPLNAPPSNSGLFQQALNLGIPTIGPTSMSQYFTPDNQIAQPTLANVTSPQQYADEQALNQLIGAGTVQENAPADYSIPTGIGQFDSQAAAQGLYNASSYPNVSSWVIANPSQQNGYLDLMHQLGALLGTPFPGLPTGPTPITDPNNPPINNPPGGGGGGRVLT